MEITNQHYLIDKDAFSSGQISSKIWLCEQLEHSNIKCKHIAIYGGWYGITAFLILSRNNLPVEKITSYDIDPQCQDVADMINENWVWKNWKFKAYTYDCNKLSSEADLIINTSTEHFESLDWYNNIPQGTFIALQGNNMPHDDHKVICSTLNEFCEQFSVSQILYKGQLDFEYQTWRFSRYMLIGVK